MQIDLSQPQFIDQTLCSLLIWLEKSTGIEFTIISPKEAKVISTLPMKRVCLRVSNRDISQKIEEQINRHWTYDRDKPRQMCAVLRGVGLSLHLEVKAHRKTCRRQVRRPLSRV